MQSYETRKAEAMEEKRTRIWLLEMEGLKGAKVLKKIVVNIE